MQCPVDNETFVMAERNGGRSSHDAGQKPRKRKFFLGELFDF